MKTQIVLAILLGITLQASVYNLKYVKDPEAKCLDGSPGAYYILDGSGLNKTKFIVYFEGGGWCGSKDLASTVESCYQRSSTTLGSSKSYSQTADLASWGMLSGEPSVNSLYYDWTKIYIKYCTGTGHQGTKSSPVKYKGIDLYFRGQNVTVAILNDVNESHGLFRASEILVGGCSAGGLAAYTWANYIFSKAPAAKVITAPDSGMFLDSMNYVTKQYDYRNSFINFMKISNEEVDPPIPECVRDNPNEKWRCMFAQYQYPYIRTPLFPVNSLYDSWSIPNILGLHCEVNSSLKACNADERKYIEDYRKNSSDTLKGMAGNDFRNGAWGIACSNHCYMHYNPWNNPNFQVPVSSGATIQAVVGEWMRNERGNNSHIDSVPWPNNNKCAGATFNLISE